MGIDLNEDLIYICKEKGHKAVYDDAFNFFKLTKETFDIITFNDVLEHFRKDEALELLKTAKEKLNAEGLIIIKVPNANYLFSAWYRYRDFTHEITYEKESLQYLLRLAKFDVIVCREFKTQQKNFIRRIIRDFLLKINQLLFLIYEGEIRPIEMSIFVIGK